MLTFLAELYCSKFCSAISENACFEMLTVVSSHQFSLVGTYIHCPVYISLNAQDDFKLNQTQTNQISKPKCGKVYTIYLHAMLT